MEFSLEEKLDLLWSVCGELVKEREKYNVIKNMTDEEVEKLHEEFEIKIKMDKMLIEDKIQRLEKLKNKLKSEMD